MIILAIIIALLSTLVVYLVVIEIDESKYLVIAKLLLICSVSTTVIIGICLYKLLS